MLLRKKLSLRPIAYYHNLAIITVAGLTLINQWRKLSIFLIFNILMSDVIS